MIADPWCLVRMLGEALPIAASFKVWLRRVWRGSPFQGFQIEIGPNTLLVKKFISSKNPIIPTGPRRDLAAMACPLCSEAFFAQFVEGVLATRQYNGHHGCKDEGTLPSEARMRVQNRAYH